MKTDFLWSAADFFSDGDDKIASQITIKRLESQIEGRKAGV